MLRYFMVRLSVFNYHFISFLKCFLEMSRNMKKARGITVAACTKGIFVNLILLFSEDVHGKLLQRPLNGVLSGIFTHRR